ncbi:OmpA family protein [Hymenobacter terrenus]|uniref:hypothetical protein n=1 Tax=Hymenobacter terrenus TaxID=1629124 RepID=UPI0006193BCF|nr:hypothetical protein [Hymenobacter terrenus]
MKRPSSFSSGLPTSRRGPAATRFADRPALPRPSSKPFGAEALDLHFVFAADVDPDAVLGWPHPHRRGQPSTALQFWRVVKDALRYLTGHGYRGSYAAPGPHGRRNNIVSEPLPHGGGSPPVRHGGAIAHLPSHRPQLDVPPLPPFGLPGDLATLPVPPRLPQPPTPRHHPALAGGSPFVFRGESVLVTRTTPFRYSQEVLFQENSDEFVNKTAAYAAMRDLVELMHQHPNVHATIIGNAASNLLEATWPYGGNKAALFKAPSYVAEFPTIGKLMQARARAIAGLLISRGIALSRVHYDIGRLEYDKDPVSAKRKRRATIIIEDRR